MALAFLPQNVSSKRKAHHALGDVSDRDVQSRAVPCPHASVSEVTMLIRQSPVAFLSIVSSSSAPQ